MSPISPVLISLILAPGTANSASEAAADSYKIGGVAWFKWQKLDFDTIEAWADALRDPKKAATSGTPYSLLFYPSFWGPLNKENQDMADTSWKLVFRTWLDLKPKSPTPHLVHAAKFMRLASEYRGVNYAHMVTQEDMQRAIKLWSEAHQHLLLHEHIADADYAWYGMMLAIESNLPIERGVVYKRLIEGIEKYPDVARLYTLGAWYSQPEWGGSWVELNGWVESVVKKTKARHGMAMHTHVYSHLRLEPDLYLQPLLSRDHWQRIKQGMADIEQRSPEGNFAEQFVEMACAARDEAMIVKYRVILYGNGSEAATKPGGANIADGIRSATLTSGSTRCRFPTSAERPLLPAWADRGERSMPGRSAIALSGDARARRVPAKWHCFT